MEVMLKGSTTIGDSPKKFAISRLDFENNTPTNITLSEFESTDTFERVSVNVKVYTTTDPISLPGGKKKQDVIVADSSVGALWQNDVGCLQEQESYTLKGFVVREYASAKYLSMAKNGSEIIPISDIGEVEVTFIL